MREKSFKGSGHFVLIGNSPFLPVIIEEISRSGFPETPSLVILSTMQFPFETSKEFRKKITLLNENPLDQSAIARTAPHAARSVFVNTYGEADADRKAVAIIKNLLENCGVLAKNITLIVSNEEAQKKITASFPLPPKMICIHSIFTRIIAQSARQRFLTEVYEELFSFHGNEFYSIPATDLGGEAFSRCLRLYANACPVGIRTKESLHLNPPVNTIVKSEDFLVVLAPAMHAIQKNDSILPAPNHTEFSKSDLGKVPSEAFLFLGWNRLCPEILSNLDQYAPQGSLINCYSRPSQADLIAIPELKNIKITHATGEIFSQEFLATIPWEHFENIVLPGTGLDGDEETIELRQLLEKVLAERGFTNNITTVLWFPKENPTENPERGTLSISLIFRMAAQQLFHPEFARVVEDLTTINNPEISLNPVENYIHLDKPLDFYTIIEAARNKNETAIGYIQDKNIFLNPEKSARKQFNHFDQIVVLSDKKIDGKVPT